MPKLEVPEPVLKRGDKGSEVIKLQMVLNHLGYNCGDADGDFGKITAGAVNLLQANNRLPVDGVYDTATRDAIESLLQS